MVTESIFVEDESFSGLDKIPTKIGVYELDCDLFWDDGFNLSHERTDAGFEVKIKSVKPLYYL